MKKNIKTLKFEGEELFLEIGQYANNGSLAILAYTKEDMYGDITINLNGYSLEKNKSFINSITKDSGLEKKLMKEGIIKEIITSVEHNMGKYDLVEFNLEKLREYDPKGIKEYEKNSEEELE